MPVLTFPVIPLGPVGEVPGTYLWVQSEGLVYVWDMAQSNLVHQGPRSQTPNYFAARGMGGVVTLDGSTLLELMQDMEAHGAEAPDFMDVPTRAIVDLASRWFDEVKGPLHTRLAALRDGMPPDFSLDPDSPHTEARQARDHVIQEFFRTHMTVAGLVQRVRGELKFEPDTTLCFQVREALCHEICETSGG